MWEQGLSDIHPSNYSPWWLWIHYYQHKVRCFNVNALHTTKTMRKQDNAGDGVWKEALFCFVFVCFSGKEGKYSL